MSLAPASPGLPDAHDSEPEWLRRFHAGEAQVLEECYRDHFDTVSRAVGSILSGADRETVVHEVFFRLLSNPAARSSFQGGVLGAWLWVVARRQALDFVRARSRESAAVSGWSDDAAQDDHALGSEVLERRMEARRLVERFRREVLPDKWAAVFEACFLRQLSQREAAAELRMSRTTLAYQELRIRALLKKFFLKQESP